MMGCVQAEDLGQGVLVVFLNPPFTSREATNVLTNENVNPQLPFYGILSYLINVCYRSWVT